MKNRSHIALLAGFFVSLALYVLLFFWDSALEVSELHAVLCLSFSAVPAFFLQLWLCQLEYVRWTRWLPLCALLFAALVGSAYLSGLVGGGWDVLGGVLILCWCVAPAAGCALGWMAHGGKRARRLGAAGLAALLAAYAGIKYLGGPRPFFLRFELMDLPVLAVLAAGAWLLRREKEGGKRASG